MKNGVLENKCQEVDKIHTKLGNSPLAEHFPYKTKKSSNYAKEIIFYNVKYLHVDPAEKTLKVINQ